MKNVGRCVILAVVGALLAATLSLVGTTDWADGVRETVKKARAERRARMEAQARAENVVPKGADSVQNVGKEASGKDGAISSKPKGPKAKPPQLTGEALAQGGSFLLIAGLSAAFSGGVLAISRRATRRRRRKEKK